MKKVRKDPGIRVSRDPLQGTLPLALLGITLSAALPARADDECGPAAGLTEVRCDAGPYDHIRYTSTTGLTLRVEEGAVVDQLDGSHDAVQLSGTGDDLLRVEVAEGASVTARGDSTQAVHVIAREGSNSRIEIDIAGELSASSTKALTDGSVSFGALAWVLDAGNSSDASIVQHASSTITARGVDAGGLYIATEGQGNATITTAGSISVEDGHSASGAAIWTRNTLAGTEALIEQLPGGEIRTSGTDVGGMTVGQRGLGDATIRAGGRVST